MTSDENTLFAFAVNLRLFFGSLERFHPERRRSSQRGYMGVSKCCLLDCDFLRDPSTPPRRPPLRDHFLCFPCVSQVWTSSHVSVPTLSPPCDRSISNPPNLLLHFCDNSYSVYWLWWMWKEKQKKGGAALVDRTLPPCETLSVCELTWSPCTAVRSVTPLCWQSLVLVGAQAEEGGRKRRERRMEDGGRGDGAHAFLFFNFVVKVSYFVQLQSWSLREERVKHKRLSRHGL